LARFPDGGIDAVVGIDKYVFTPDRAKDLFSRHQALAVFSQQQKQLQRDAFQFDELAVAAKLKGPRVEFEAFEVDGFLQHDERSVERLILRLGVRQTK
jgi:hypothetical protein